MPDLDSWLKYWKLENSGSRELKLQLRGRLFTTLAEQRTLTPEDFRFQDDVSAVGETENAGANLDVVGAGPGYERWRSSGAYQQWLSQLDGVLK